MEKYISKVQVINHEQQKVYDHLSNFENLSGYLNSGLIEKITQQIPQVKISNFESDRDSCQFQISGLGLAKINIVKREPYKTIKIQNSGGLPLSFNFWIQLLPIDGSSTKIRLTLHAEMSMIIKMMAGKKLQDGVDQLAERLAALPYK